MAIFGERIKELRKKKGLTQRQMADNFGITERNYQRYEVSDSPSNDTLLKLADFFGVTTDYLLGRTDNQQKVMQHKVEQHDPNSPNNESPRLKFLFNEPFESYAQWLRKEGVHISGGGNSGQIIVEIEKDEIFEISESEKAILNMSKDHFKLLVRQLGKRWP